MICTYLVKSKIQELELNNENVAKALELTPQGWYKKLNGERNLTIKEMFILQKILKLEDEELKTYFLS